MGQNVDMPGPSRSSSGRRLGMERRAGGDSRQVQSERQGGPMAAAFENSSGRLGADINGVRKLGIA